MGRLEKCQSALGWTATESDLLRIGRVRGVIGTGVGLTFEPHLIAMQFSGGNWAIGAEAQQAERK